MSVAATTNNEQRTTNMFVRLFASEYLILVLCAIYFALMAWSVEGFASWGNIQNIIIFMIPLLVVATGQTLVLITAGIDLSSTSIIALASVLGAMVINSETGALAGSAIAAPVGLSSVDERSVRRGESIPPIRSDVEAR